MPRVPTEEEKEVENEPKSLCAHRSLTVAAPLNPTGTRSQNKLTKIEKKKKKKKIREEREERIKNGYLSN